jgi:hypothetical protein
MTAHVAVFVDGENISADHAATIRATASALGTVDVLRVYGNASTQPRWSEAPGFRLIHSGTGKNATDILMTVQAMEAALSNSFAAVVIASSDRDFTHLATRIRELGVTVIGVGEAKSPAQFHAACTRFVTVQPKQAKVAQTRPAKTAETDPKKPAREVGALDRQIRTFIAANSTNGQGVAIHHLGPRMHALHGIRISTYPERTWRAYLQNRPTLYTLDPKGPNAKVRFKPAGFATGG